MSEELLEIFNSFEVQTMLKLLLCIFLSGFIGKEREGLHKPAGTRTHMLLGITGCLVVMLSEYLAMKCNMQDYTRIPAQLLSGIGFIGARNYTKRWS